MRSEIGPIGQQNEKLGQINKTKNKYKKVWKPLEDKLEILIAWNNDYQPVKLCCGSVRIRRIHMFLGLRIRIRNHQSEIRIRIFLSSSKNSKKNIDSYTVLWLLSDFLSLKNDVNVPSKSKKQKKAGSSQSADLNPNQNFMDPQHCCKGIPWQDPWVAGQVEREFNLIFLIKNCNLLIPRPP